MRVRDALLALLARGPAHGYQLKLDYERLARDRPVNVGQIYQTLERLQRDALVEREDDDPSERRVTYHVTDAGRARAHDFLFDTTQPHCAGQSDVTAKVLLAIEVPDIETVAVLDAHRAALLVTVRAARRAAKGRATDVVDRLGVEADLAVTEAELRWLDLCEDELKGHG